jgi:hypothetical protein
MLDSGLGRDGTRWMGWCRGRLRQTHGGFALLRVVVAAVRSVLVRGTEHQLQWGLEDAGHSHHHVETGYACPTKRFLSSLWGVKCS